MANMSVIQRVLLIVLDSVGIGDAPDAHLYSDEGTNTLGNISIAIEGLKLPPSPQGLGIH